jgi:hypothetical protein
MTVEEAEFPMTFSGSGQCPCGEELDHMHLLWRFGTQQAAVVGVCCDCFRSAPPYAWCSARTPALGPDTRSLEF